MKNRPRRTGWEPTVFRWSFSTTVGLGAAAGAAALVWGEDLTSNPWTRGITLVVALAALVAAYAVLSAYRRQAALMRAQLRAWQAHHRSNTPVFDQEKEARR